jgi:hypothetical protein
MFLLLSDIKEIKEAELGKLKKLLNQKLETPEETKKPTLSAKEMLDNAGYTLYDDIEKESDYSKFKKYYRQNELLCKFNSYDATERYHRVYWIVRKDIDSIERPENPTRQDKYGTSCMSVAISKDKQNVAQICNRYNHTVNGADNTFNSNLDNIVEGLTDAFNQDYNLSLKQGASVEFENFYTHNGKYIFYYYEINGKKYGNNTIDGKYYDPSRYFIFENFILDIKERHIKTADSSTDGFTDMVNEKLKKGDTIQIKKGEMDDDNIDDTGKIIIYI